MPIKKRPAFRMTKSSKLRFGVVLKHCFVERRAKLTGICGYPHFSIPHFARKLIINGKLIYRMTFENSIKGYWFKDLASRSTLPQLPGF